MNDDLIRKSIAALCGKGYSYPEISRILYEQNILLSKDSKMPVSKNTIKYYVKKHNRPLSKP